MKKIVEYIINEIAEDLEIWRKLQKIFHYKGNRRIYLLKEIAEDIAS